MAPANDLTASVLASPGTPSSSRWPPASRPIAIRSSSTSWPTIVRLTSKRTRSSGCIILPVGAVLVMRPPKRWRPGLRQRELSYLRPVPGAGAGTAEGGADRHGEGDAGEGVVGAHRFGDGDDDADDVAVRV